MSETTNGRLTSKGGLVFGRDEQIKQDLASWKREHNPEEVKRYDQRKAAAIGMFDDAEVAVPTSSVRITVLYRDRGTCRLITTDCAGDVEPRYVNDAGGRTNAPFDVAHAIALCDYHGWVANRQNPYGLATRRLLRAMLGIETRGTHDGG